MTALDRHRVTWGGFIGAPGLSTFYCTSSFPMNAHLHTFFGSLAPLLPSDVTIQIEPTGDTIASTDGMVTGEWADAAQAIIHGTDEAGYSAVSGALARWYSSVFLSGRRLRGHTFIVPFAGDHYNTDGRIYPTDIATVSAAQTALIEAGSGTMMLWQRPRVAQPAYTDRRGVVHPAITARGGGYGSVTTGACRDMVTELRTRRD